MDNNTFTPKTIESTSIEFSIPLYQRLFEWEAIEIEQLLKDLYSSFELYKDNHEPYYIGMLTIYDEGDGKFSLVDGQQRFTVLTLMAIAFNWNSFLQINNDKNRLSFFARKKDATYLSKKIKQEIVGEYSNRKMEQGISVIQDFIEKLPTTDIENFINYIHEYATFFITSLPKTYGPQDLNRYFEAMNAGGKSLENHEILKVNLLKLVDPNKKEFYTKQWNSISEMDKCLLRQKTWDKENVEKFHNRIKTALNSLDNDSLFEYCNDYNKDNNNEVNSSIRNIEISSKEPKKGLFISRERSILTFTEFLLQVLWMQLSTDQRKNTVDFFNIHKLQQTFKKNLSNSEVNVFMDNLLKYRVLFDYYILRIYHNKINDVGYSLNFSADGEDREEQQKLLQFQSMLYVSTSSHLWLTLIFSNLIDNATSINTSNYLNMLKSVDNKLHLDKVDFTFTYGSIDRYWFWRLDYYLWENRVNNFKDSNSLEIANKYLFKPNRSIEHIAPQKPKSDSKTFVSKDLLHSFGNLAMISSGQNSSLQNDSYEMKKAHVKSFTQGENTGTIESLKMLKLYDNEHWKDRNVEVHANEMFTILKESLPLDSTIKFPFYKFE